MNFHYVTAEQYRTLFGSGEHETHRKRLEVHIPFPPSTNELRRTRSKEEIQRANASGRSVRGMANTKRYQTWRRAAKNMLLGQDLFLMPGPFSVTIIQPSRHRKRASDLDNRIKAVLDFLQSQKLIEDDKLCEGILTHWSPEHEHTVVYVVPTEPTSIAA